ncbi:MAG: hypothetical protein GY749_09915 [Desulfobacteraceae bacterium]|nr:hypothetical protein [Desulfobacteraceae bacterium]
MGIECCDGSDYAQLQSYGNYWLPPSFGGNTLVSSGSEDIFIAKYDSNGILQWAKGAGGPGTDTGWKIDTDGYYVYVTAHLYHLITPYHYNYP